MDEICHSTIAFFVIPNYCDYPCANFFIFNERSQCYFQNHPEQLDQYLKVKKKFIIVSNSKAESFAKAFEQHTDQEPQILFLSARKHGHISTAGDLMNVDTAKAELEAFIQCE